MPAAAIPAAVWLAAGTAGGTAAAGYLGSRASGQAAKTQSDAATRAAEIQTAAAERAAELAAKSNAEALAFERDKETRRRFEYDDLNIRNKQMFDEDLARRQPYMNLGLGAIAKMGQPLPARPQAGAGPGAPYQPLYSRTPPPPGTLGDILAKKA